MPFIHMLFLLFAILFGVTRCVAAAWRASLLARSETYSRLRRLACRSDGSCVHSPPIGSTFRALVHLHLSCSPWTQCNSILHHHCLITWRESCLIKLLGFSSDCFSLHAPLSRSSTSPLANSKPITITITHLTILHITATWLYDSHRSSQLPRTGSTR